MIEKTSMVVINEDTVKALLKARKVSIKALSEKMGYSDKTIRRYLKAGKMPRYIALAILPHLGVDSILELNRRYDVKRDDIRPGLFVNVPYCGREPEAIERDIKKLVSIAKTAFGFNNFDVYSPYYVECDAEKLTEEGVDINLYRIGLSVADMAKCAFYISTDEFWIFDECSNHNKFAHHIPDGKRMYVSARILMDSAEYEELVKSRNKLENVRRR